MQNIKNFINKTEILNSENLSSIYAGQTGHSYWNEVNGNCITHYHDTYNDANGNGRRDGDESGTLCAETVCDPCPPDQ